MGLLMLNGVPYGGDNAASREDIASIITTGSTNATGATITAGTYFYLNGTLVRALADIASGASYTLNTNYAAVTVGNELYNYITIHSTPSNKTYKQALAELYPYITALGSKRRHAAIIKGSSTIFNVQLYTSTVIIFSSTIITTTGELRIETYRLDSTTSIIATLTTIATDGTVTVTDITDNTYSSFFVLFLV